MENVLLVGLGGAIGASLRYILSGLSPIRGIPAGTALVNISGSIIFAFVAFSPSPGSAYFLIDAGILSGYTTFSTFSFEVFRMLEDHDYLHMAGTILINLVGSIGGAFLGYILITRLV